MGLIYRWTFLWRVLMGLRILRLIRLFWHWKPDKIRPIRHQNRLRPTRRLIIIVSTNQYHFIRITWSDQTFIILLQLTLVRSQTCKGIDLIRSFRKQAHRFIAWSYLLVYKFIIYSMCLYYVSIVLERVQTLQHIILFVRLQKSFASIKSSLQLI